MIGIIDTALVYAMTAVSSLKVRLAEERGQDLIEYALLGGFIAVAFVVAALALPLSGAMTDMVTAVGECVDFDQVCP